MLLSDRMKLYESHQTNNKLMLNLPIMVRLDGKSFHSWCRTAQRPFDNRVQTLFDETTKYLVDKVSNVVVGYTQSDEITLVLWNNSEKSEPLFGNKIFKLTSVIASMCTAKFNSLVSDIWPENKNLAFFDCRVWNVPSKEEAVNCIIWRELDATRNAIQMAAQSMFSHKSLQNLDCDILQEKMFLEKGVNFNNYPSRFKRGAYFKKVKSEIELDQVEIDSLPPKHNLRKGEAIKVTRSSVDLLSIPPLLKIPNRVDMIFNGAEPELFTELQIDQQF